MKTKIHSEVIAGIDIGGNDIKSGATDLNGFPCETDLSEVMLSKLPSLVKEGPLKTLAQVEQALYSIREDYLTDEDNGIKAIGLSTAGPADLNGVIQKSTNYGIQWNQYGIRVALEKKFGIKTYYENDANAAALAEYNELIKTVTACIGVAGITFTVGTGLGSGIINTGGDIERGAFGLAGELGHIPLPQHERFGNVDVESPLDQSKEELCGCEGLGHSEQFTNLKFIERELYHSLVTLDTGRDHSLYSDVLEDSKSAAKKVLSLAGRGDNLCQEIILNQAKNLGAVIANASRTNDPGWIIIGGGITEAEPFLKDAYLRNIKEVLARSNPLLAKNGYIDFAKLGDHAGWYGAALSASKQIK